MFLFITRYKLLFDDWRGYLIAGFSLVWVANVYMSLFGRLRLDIKEEKVEIAAAEAKAKDPVASAFLPPVASAKGGSRTMAGRR